MPECHWQLRHWNNAIFETKAYANNYRCKGMQEQVMACLLSLVLLLLYLQKSHPHTPPRTPTADLQGVDGVQAMRLDRRSSGESRGGVVWIYLHRRAEIFASR